MVSGLDGLDGLADFIAGIVAGVGGDVTDLTPCPLPLEGSGRAASIVAGVVADNVAGVVAGVVAADAMAELIAVFAAISIVRDGTVGLAMGAGGSGFSEIMGAEHIIATILAGVEAVAGEVDELIAVFAVGPGLGGISRCDYGRSSGRSGRFWVKRSAQ